MNITVHSSSWATDPYVLAPALVLVGSGLVWLVGRLFTVFGRLVVRR